MNHSVWVNAAKAWTEEILKDKIVAFAVSHFAFLGSGPFGYLLGKLAEKLASYLADTAELRAFYKYSDFRATKEGQAFMEAAIKFQQAKDEGDGEFIAKTRKELIDAARVFIKF